MIPLSAGTRRSLVRSTIRPMLSCSDESWIAMPLMPEYHSPVFCFSRFIR